MNDVPDVYADGYQIITQAGGTVIKFQRSRVGPGMQLGANPAGEDVVYVRLSLEQAKVLAIALRKALKAHEDSQQTLIPIHPAAAQQNGISALEDW